MACSRSRVLVLIYGNIGSLVNSKHLIYENFLLGVRTMAGKHKKPSWEDRVSRHLKAQLKQAGVTYDELAERLKKHDHDETKASIANKLNRGTFPATFFVASLTALGVENLRLGDI
jgi:hypothetical protein